jgi:signal transduction histidine kinase
MPTKDKTDATAPAARLADELLYLREISQAISEGAALDWLFRRIVEIVAESLDVDIVSLMLVEADVELGKDVLRIKAARGLADEIVRDARVELGCQISGLVAANGQALLLNDVESSGLGVAASRPRYRGKGLLSAPIKARAQIIGVLNVNNKTAGGVFDERDLALLTTLCSQAGLAIDNTRLFEDLRAHAGRLAALNAQLDRVNQAKSELIVNLSHEIKTPLTTIQGYVELLRTGLISPLKVPEVLAKVQERSRHLSRLAERLIAFFALDSGSAKFLPESFPINVLIRECADELRSRAAAKQVAIEIDDNSLRLVAWADRMHYREALSSLLDNAVKFNVKGGAARIYGAAAVGQGGAPLLEIFVQDGGPGIPENLQEAIFEDFKQTDDIMCAKPDGLGLGLAIARAVGQAHQCRLRLVRSGPAGSVFGMTIPLDASAGGERNPAR